jgi:hypothetical protein
VGPRAKQAPGKAPKFTVTWVGTAIADAKNVPTKLQRALLRIIERLAREGCRAADYALSGDPPWPHLCAVHFDGWRVIVAFPTAGEVAILKIAPHDAANDPYREIAEELGVQVSTAARTKPPCCDPAGDPPDDQAILDQLDAAFGRLTRRKQRERSRR